MTGTRPTVSIVIPVYNTGELLRETVASVLNQTLTSLEVLIVDDCSSDATPDVIRQLQDGDDRIRYFRLPANSNRPAVPRNLGLSQAMGEYVAFLDHDDLWLFNKLERQVAVLESEPNVAMVHSALLSFPGKRQARSLLALPNPFLQVTNRANLRSYNRVQCSSVLARADALREVGGFDERLELRAVEDYHLWLRMSSRYTIRYISEIHGYYRSSAGSTSALEDMGKRLGFLEGEGLIEPKKRDRIQRRAFRRAWGLPMSLIYHLPNAHFRQWLRVRPRTF